MLLDTVSLTRLSIGRMSYLDPSNLAVTDAGYLSSFGCPQMGGLVEFGDRLSPDSIREYRSPVWHDPPCICLPFDIFYLWPLSFFLCIVWALEKCGFGQGNQDLERPYWFSWALREFPF